MFVSLDPGSADTNLKRPCCSIGNCLHACRPLPVSNHRLCRSEAWFGGFHQLISVDGITHLRDEEMAAGISSVIQLFPNSSQMPISRQIVRRRDTDKGAPQVALISQSTARLGLPSKIRSAGASDSVLRQRT